MAISHILEQTINHRIRDYFEKGQIPFAQLAISVDGNLIDVIFYPEGLPEGSATLYISTDYPKRSEITLTLPIELGTE